MVGVFIEERKGLGREGRVVGFTSGGDSILTKLTFNFNVSFMFIIDLFYWYFPVCPGEYWFYFTSFVFFF